MKPGSKAKPGSGELAYVAGGQWCLSPAPLRSTAGVPRSSAPRRRPAGGEGADRLRAAGALDTVGAWLILRLKAALGQRGAEVSLDNLAERFAPLLTQAEKYEPEGARKHRRHFPGRSTSSRRSATGPWRMRAMPPKDIDFLGEVTLATGRVLRHCAGCGRSRFLARCNGRDRRRCRSSGCCPS